MSLEDIPQSLADYWSINLESAQIILSVSVIFAMLLPVLYLTKGKGFAIPSVTFIFAEALLVGITWLPSWVMIVTVVIIALLWAKEGSEFVGG